jgi:hypothetical protein
VKYLAPVLVALVLVAGLGGVAQQQAATAYAATCDPNAVPAADQLPGENVSVPRGKLSQRQISVLWVRVGGPRGDVNGDGIDEPTTAGAVGIAESGDIRHPELGADPLAINSIGATGLMQIHPGDPKFLDPVVNMREAVRKR